MTETEMDLIRNLLFEKDETLVYFDERRDDKQMLLVTADEPTYLRYIIYSPVATEAEKSSAKTLLVEELEEPLDVQEGRERHILFEAKDVAAEPNPA